MNLIEQLNDLCTKYEDSYSSAYFMADDLRAIIEQHKSEAVESSNQNGEDDWGN